MNNKPNIQLRHSDIPQVGLGLWKITNPQDLSDAITFALKSGYRHFDTAQIYDNEALLGKTLEASNTPRSELFITTKVWNDNMENEVVQESIEESLKNLRTNYIDLVLLHFPVTGFRNSAWKALEKMKKSGKARNIGVSNFTIKHLEDLAKHSSISPTINQVELHVYLQQPELVAYCRDHHITLEAYSPLAHGNGLDNQALIEIGKKYHKTAAQIMLKWLVQKGFVLIPKSIKEQHIIQNIDLFDFELDEEDLETIKGLDKGMRTCWDPTNVI